MADGNTFTDSADRVAELRKRKAAREKLLADEKAAAEIEAMDLEERFAKELGGRLNRDFVIVDASDLGEGFVVLKLGEDVLWNTFKASKMNAVDTDCFVFPCVVHPSKDAYRLLAKRRAFLPERCAGALATLYGVKLKEDAGK